MRTAALVAALALAAASAAAAPPKYSDIVLSATKDGPASKQFKTSTPKVYLRAKVAEGQAGIKVRGDWIAVKTQVAPPNYKVDSYEMALKPGMNNVTFSLSAPTAGWPEGEYRVDLFIDGRPAGNVPFRVSK